MQRRGWVSVGFMAASLLIGFGGGEASAQSSYFASQCGGCHTGVASTCNGCHAHGTHGSSAKSSINITGATNKSSYAPGEAVSVTISGGYRSGWIRALLYDQNGVEIGRSTGAATGGMGGGAGYPITLSAPAPVTAGTYSWKIAWYGNQYDAAGAAFGAGWTPDPNNPNHGQEVASINSFTVAAAPPVDSQPPSIASFSLPTSSGTLTVPVSSFVASDNVAVTGYLVTTSASAPTAAASGWTATPPSSVSAAFTGSTTFYAWAKDAAGNISLPASATVTIGTADTTAPAIVSFTLPPTASTLTVPVNSFAASDNVAVTGYLITASSAAPTAADSGWSAGPPSSVTAVGSGSSTFYAWAKDAAGNVSTSGSATVDVTLAGSGGGTTGGGSTGGSTGRQHRRKHGGRNSNR